VIRGADSAMTINVATQPQFVRVSPDRQRLYVVGNKAITALDYSSFHVESQIEIADGGILRLRTASAPQQLWRAGTELSCNGDPTSQTSTTLSD
jgi:hypothetical protein